MKVSYPKHPKEIEIRITRQNTEGGLRSASREVVECSLAEKLGDYLYRLGYSGTYVTGIVIQLLSRGKIQVDFPEYTERLELINLADCLSSPQAISLLDDFMVEVKPKEEIQDLKATGKIIISPFRRKP